MANSQSVEAISNLMAHEATLPKEPEKYRMPDNQIVTIILPVGLARKMAGNWKEMLHNETVAVRAAMRHALWDEYGVKSDPQGSETVDPRKDLPA